MAIPVPSVVTKCSVCGEPLNAKGHCPACLLRTGLDKSVAGNVQPVSLVFGDFEVVRRDDGSLSELGRGGMGVTYLAADKVLRRKVALKVIDVPAVPVNRDSEAVRERFLREARAAAGLRHPNVAAVYQFGASPDGSRCYYAMELVEGETLETRVRRVGPLDAELVLEIATQVMRALAAAAAQGLIHRDLKPSNIMLTNGETDTAEPEVKVIDFGLAKAIADAEEMDITHGEFVGTLNFASPEQFETAPVDVRSDIYSLGATLWFALTGKTPFSGRNIEEIRHAHKSGALPIEQLKTARVPCRLRWLLQSMLAIEPSARPGIADLAAKLRACSTQASRVRRIRIAAVSAAILIFGASAFSFFNSGRTRPAPPESNSNAAAHEKRIAVLPFENLNKDEENAFFVGGMQDEILTDLAKVADLKVISRTSVMKYKSELERNLPELAKTLAVSHVVEGSVQRAGGRIRVNVQLIDARNDAHLWAEHYDREVEDVFAIQSEIAQTIADQLQAKLSPNEKAAIAERPTRNLAAYDLYLRAKELIYEVYLYPSREKENALKAVQLLDQAVARDPTFLLAHCQLAYEHDLIYFDDIDHTETRLALAEASVRAAVRLQPDAGETHLAQAIHFYWGYHNYDRAREELAKAQRALPNNAEIFHFLGLIAHRQGRWDEIIPNLERAVDLDPRNASTLLDLGEFYAILRKPREAIAMCDRAAAVEPGSAAMRMYAALIRVEVYADMMPLRTVLNIIEAEDPASAGEVAVISFELALRERDPAGAARAFANLPSENYLRQADYRVPRAWHEGLLAKLRQDAPAAHAAFMAARAETEKFVHTQPQNVKPLSVLALIDAELGDKEKAIREGRTACDMAPISKDVLDGARVITILASIYALTGEKDLALEQLETVSKLPCGPSYGGLRLDPEWDLLRGDPRFEQIVASLAPTAINESVGTKTTIAVLPFENATNDPKAEYLSEGISEALINSLTELQQLRVIARSTAFHYRGKDIDPRRVGRELQVAAVLTGRVRQMQDALSVQVDLVDANTGAQLWGAGYDGKISDVIAVKQAIAREVTEKLKLKLSGEEQRRLVKLDSTNAEAYQFYLRGRYFWNKRTPDGIKRAFEQFQQAIEHDPNFALGYVGLADSYTALTFYNFAAPHDAMPKAKESALKALALDNTVAEAHASLAHILMNYDWDWSAAEKEFKRSIELKPDYATAHQWYAIHYLTATGRFEEAVLEMKKALELEPASLVMNTFMGATLYYAGRYEEAIDQCRRTIQMDPNFAVAHWHLGLAYEQKQLLDAATEEFQKAISLSGGSPLMQAALGHAYAMSHMTYEANKVLDELHELSKQQYVSPYEMAAIYVALGNNEQALQLLEKAYTEHSFHLANLNVSPQFKSVRSDPRFQDVVRRVGLPR